MKKILKEKKRDGRLKNQTGRHEQTKYETTRKWKIRQPIIKQIVMKTILTKYENEKKKKYGIWRKLCVKNDGGETADEEDLNRQEWKSVMKQTAMTNICNNHNSNNRQWRQRLN